MHPRWNCSDLYFSPLRLRGAKSRRTHRAPLVRQTGGAQRRSTQGIQICRRKGATSAILHARTEQLGLPRGRREAGKSEVRRAGRGLAASAALAVPLGRRRGGPAGPSMGSRGCSCSTKAAEEAAARTRPQPGASGGPRTATREASGGRRAPGRTPQRAPRSAGLGARRKRHHRRAERRQGDGEQKPPPHPPPPPPSLPFSPRPGPPPARHTATRSRAGGQPLGAAGRAAKGTAGPRGRRRRRRQTAAPDLPPSPRHRRGGAYPRSPPPIRHLAEESRCAAPGRVPPKGLLGVGCPSACAAAGRDGTGRAAGGGVGVTAGRRREGGAAGGGRARVPGRAGGRAGAPARRRGRGGAPAGRSRPIAVALPRVGGASGRETAPGGERSGDPPLPRCSMAEPRPVCLHGRFLLRGWRRVGAPGRFAPWAALARLPLDAGSVPRPARRRSRCRAPAPGRGRCGPGQRLRRWRVRPRVCRTAGNSSPGAAAGRRGVCFPRRGRTGGCPGAGAVPRE